MNTSSILSIVLLFSALASARTLDPPTSQEPTEVDPEYGEYFEGDMVLDAEQMEAILSSSRNGLLNTTYRWPDKTVVYEMTTNHTKEQQLYIKMAHWVIESVSCIKFVQRTNESHYIQYRADSGCRSKVGFRNQPQVLNLGPYPLGRGCFRLGTIVHEHLHALGFYHMQSTYDRDDYVQIQWKNIIGGHEHNFKKYNSSVVTNLNSTYDYDSILHYSAYGFAKNRTLPTIVPLDETYLDKIGQRTHLSDADIEKLNTMYECDGEYPAPGNFAKKAFEWERQMNQN